jgi:hypothetical protein
MTGEDLLAGVENHRSPRLGGLPLAFQEADLVCSGEARQETEGEQEGAEAKAAGHAEKCMLGSRLARKSSRS